MISDNVSNNQPDSLFILILAYNDEASIEQVIRKWYPCLNGKGNSSRLVVNCSSNARRTLRILEKLSPEFPALEWLQSSKNAGSRLLDLYRYAVDHGADYVFQTDTDMQTRTAEFDAFWEQRRNHHIIIGTSSHCSDGWLRRFLQRVDTKLLWHFFHIEVMDANIPFRLISRLIIENYLELIPENCSLPNVFLTALAVAGREEVQFREIPLKSEWSHREKVNSFLNIFNIFTALALFNTLSKRFAYGTVHQTERARKLYILTSCSLHDILRLGLRKFGLTKLKPENINEKTANTENYKKGKILKMLAHDYFRIMKRKLEINDPITFCEKIQWMKIYDSTALKTRLADKYLVKNWIAETVGPEYVIPVYGVWDDESNIDFDSLPESFILKANNSHNKNIKIKNNSLLSDKEKEEIREMCGKWLKDDFSMLHCELHYKNIKPLIIAEQLLPDFLLGSNEYKFLCIDGKIVAIYDFQRVTQRTEWVTCTDMYSRKWKKLDWSTDAGEPSIDQKVDPPETLPEMIRLAERLSKGFALVRVDFYDVESKIYVGEMTFTPSAGYCNFTSLAYETALGRMIHLPEPTQPPIPIRK